MKYRLKLQHKKNKKMTLYHATYKPLLKSINRYGLLMDNKKKSYSFSEKGIYLTDDKDLALSFAENSQMPEKWVDNIVILKIDMSLLNRDNLFEDKNYGCNNLSNYPKCYIYKDNINYDKIKMVRYKG